MGIHDALGAYCMIGDASVRGGHEDVEIRNQNEWKGSCALQNPRPEDQYWSHFEAILR
jgi:hypothetical protein